MAPVFVVPKPNGTWRPIVHLSYKRWGKLYSINDLLYDYVKTVQYIKFREVVHLVNNAGPGAFIFLIDAQDAYYRVPIQPSDWKYMGIKWAQKLWVFRSLQMGCSSSPKIYTEFADAVEYICVNKNKKLSFLNGTQQLRHYMDDFFGVLPNYKEANELFNLVINTFEELGIPTRPPKCHAPYTRRAILGWMYDTIKRVVGMKEEKRIELLNIVIKLIKVHRSDKKSLEKMIGKMQNAGMVIPHAKAFVRRLEAVLYLPRFDYNQPINLSDFVIDDLIWWKNILQKPDLCCTSFDLILKNPDDGDFKLFTDATTESGGGGFLMDKNKNILYKFQIDWKNTILYKLESMCNVDIELLELLMSVVGIVLFKDKLKNKSISIYNDNPGAAGAMRTKAPRLYRLDLQFLIRKLASLAVEYKFFFWSIHYTIKNGYYMQIADDLSRFKSRPSQFNKNTKYVDCKNCVNELINGLINCPRNLPKKFDLNDTVRAEYNILLNDNKKDHFGASPSNVYKYNILNNHI